MSHKYWDIIRGGETRYKERDENCRCSNKERGVLNGTHTSSGRIDRSNLTQREHNENSSNEGNDTLGPISTIPATGLSKLGHLLVVEETRGSAISQGRCDDGRERLPGGHQGDLEAGNRP